MISATRRSPGSALPWFGVAAAILLLDQLVKAAMTAWIGPANAEHRREILGRVLAFEYVENRGAAFGVFGDASILITVAAVVITIAASLYLALTPHRSWVEPLAISLIIGGAIGNVVDRVTRGFVVDFIAVGTWPKFNIADSAVTIGVLLMIWTTIRDDVRGTTGKTEHDD